MNGLGFDNLLRGGVSERLDGPVSFPVSSSGLSQEASHKGASFPRESKGPDGNAELEALS